MAHKQQAAFIASVRERFPDAFMRKRVLEIGSYFVNGSVRDFFVDCDYTGVDVAEGRCVDAVAPGGAAEWLWGTHPEPYDTIISAECLEHCSAWKETLAAAYAFLRGPGSMLILTCAGSRRPEHGTRRTSPADSLLVTDYYRGLDEVDLRSALPLDEFLVYEFSRCEWPSDTYLWALKK